MRFTRLKRAIESGTLIGTRGTPFTRAKKIARRQKKRKRSPGGEAGKDGAEVTMKDDFEPPTPGRCQRKSKVIVESGSSNSDDSDYEEPPVKRRRRTRLNRRSESADRLPSGFTTSSDPEHIPTPIPLDRKPGESASNAAITSTKSGAVPVRDECMDNLDPPSAQDGTLKTVTNIVRHCVKVEHPGSGSEI